MTPLTLKPGEHPGAFVRGADNTKVEIPIRWFVPLDLATRGLPAAGATVLTRRPAEFVDYTGPLGEQIWHGHQARWEPEAGGSAPLDGLTIGVALEESGPAVALLPGKWSYRPDQEFGVLIWFSPMGGPLQLTRDGRELVAE